MKTFPYPDTEARIPASVRRVRLPSGRLVYACPDDCWRSHFRAWVSALREKPDAPEPHPERHLCFGKP